jgi:hypothetical protein
MQITIIVAIIVGLTEAIKRATGINKRYVPLIALVLGLALAFLNRQGMALDLTIMTGIIAGLTSVGLYSSTKNMVE